MGHGCLGPRDAGRSHWPGPSLSMAVPVTRHHPVASLWERGSCWRCGGPGPLREPGPARCSPAWPPDGWAGGQGAPPLFLSQTPENPEWPLLSSRRKLRVSDSLPAWDPTTGSLQSWRRPNALCSSQTVLPSPPSPCPSDISFPPDPFLGVSPNRQGPQETMNQLGIL